MAKSSTGKTPFSLVYGVEALIPVEAGEPTLRYFQANEEANNEAMLVNLELLDERRDLAHIRMLAQKHNGKHTTKKVSTTAIRPFNNKAYKQRTTPEQLDNLLLVSKVPTGKLSLLSNKDYPTIHKYKPLGDC
ncbi:uncharacterized protein [Nicotiana tomentosiformis]|uniref:uncharacterized protein n=1 Tax=Nicotiana tomentosiformis TaxID=4098 RepID=UPI00388CE05A